MRDSGSFALGLISFSIQDALIAAPLKYPFSEHL
jgi:hypothetical protein